MTKKDKGRLGIVGGKKSKGSKKKGRSIPVELGHNERFLLGTLRQQATQKANAVSFALWEKIGEKTRWTDDELDILSEATEQATEKAESLAKKCPDCGTVVFGTDPDNIAIEGFLYEKDEDGEIAKDADDEPIALIPARDFNFSGYQHKMVVDILEARQKDDDLTPALWPLYKLFVGTDHLEDDDVEDDEDEPQTEGETE